MYYIPNPIRLAQLELGDHPNGSQVLFCPECPFQLEPQTAAYPRCPDCNAALHVTRITDELRELINAKTSFK